MKRFLLPLLFVAFMFSAAVTLATPTEATPTASVYNTEQTIDLNSADAATLQRELSGVGAAKARAIIEYREAHGPFASVDELLEVKGIGPAILQKNRSKLHVN